MHVDEFVFNWCFTSLTSDSPPPVDIIDDDDPVEAASNIFSIDGNRIKDVNGIVFAETIIHYRCSFCCKVFRSLEIVLTHYQMHHRHAVIPLLAGWTPPTPTKLLPIHLARMQMLSGSTDPDWTADLESDNASSRGSDESPSEEESESSDSCYEETVAPKLFHPNGQQIENETTDTNVNSPQAPLDLSSSNFKTNNLDKSQQRKNPRPKKFELKDSSDKKSKKTQKKEDKMNRNNEINRFSLRSKNNNSCSEETNSVKKDDEEDKSEEPAKRGRGRPKKGFDATKWLKIKKLHYSRLNRKNEDEDEAIKDNDSITNDNNNKRFKKKGRKRKVSPLKEELNSNETNISEESHREFQVNNNVNNIPAIIDRTSQLNKSQPWKKKLRCPEPNCLKTFLYNNSLLSHIKTHQTEDKLFTCSWPDCMFVCKDEQGLAFHMMTHSGCNPFKCSWPGCVASFPSASDKEQHMFELHVIDKNLQSDWLGSKEKLKLDVERRNQEKNEKVDELINLVVTGKKGKKRKRKTKGEEDLSPLSSLSIAKISEDHFEQEMVEDDDEDGDALIENHLKSINKDKNDFDPKCESQIKISKKASKKSKKSAKKSSRHVVDLKSDLTCDYPSCKVSFTSPESLKQHEDEAHASFHIGERTRYSRRCKSDCFRLNL